MNLFTLNFLPNRGVLITIDLETIEMRKPSSYKKKAW